MKTKYYIDYVILRDRNNTITDTYFQLVRREDEAILAAYEEIDYIFAECFRRGINKEDVSVK